MKCWLKQDQRITIGRLTSSDFSIAADAHMSRNHLVVEGLERSFRVRDVGSSNGTFVNDAPISVVELCHGDRIRAGSSIFEVVLEMEQNAPSELPLPDEELVEFIPQRTLNVDELEVFDQDATMRYNPETDGPDAQTRPPEQPTLPAEDSELAALREERRQQPREPLAPPRSRKAVPAEFLAGFHHRSGELLWRQASVPSLAESMRLIDVLIDSGSPAVVSLIVNRAQLEGPENGTLDFAVSAGESRPITETLYLLRNSRPQIVLEFYKRCLTKDAAVCVVSKQELPAAWTHDVIDVVSYPSMLFSLLSESQELAAQLMRGTQFVMFEPNTRGELCLLGMKDPEEGVAQS